MKLTPYLFFNGNCRDAFEHCARVLNGTLDVFTYSQADSPPDLPEGWQDKVMNVQLVAEGAELMGSDAPPQYKSEPGGFSVTIQIEDEARAEEIFNAMAEGGTITMPFEPTFWAKRFGMLTDRFGVSWMVNCGEAGQG